MSFREIGCCGAYCKTCRMSTSGANCRGCKLGYENGERDINKVKCKSKVCCFKERKFETCADCPDYSTCKIILSFHDKNGYKYKKYKQSIDFIKKMDMTDLLRLLINGKVHMVNLIKVNHPLN